MHIYRLIKQKVVGYTHTIEYYAALTKDKNEICHNTDGTRYRAENSKKKRDRCRMISHIWGLPICKVS